MMAQEDACGCMRRPEPKFTLWWVALCLMMPILILPHPVHSCIERYNCSKEQEVEVDCVNPAIDTVPMCLSPSLLRLSLHDTKITTLYASSLHFYSDLRHVNLSQNQIEEVQEQTFKEQLNLKELHLADNKISILTQDIFLGLNKLTVLSLRGNFIERLNDSVFYHLTQLEHLDVSANRINVIMDKAFDRLPNLRLLLINDNLLPYLPANSLELVPHLAELALGGNNFRSIEPGDFNSLTLLTYLDLSNADLSRDVAPEAFHILVGLRVLKLDGCNLVDVPTELLRNLPRLVELHLSRNMFKLVPPHSLSGNRRLRHLEISGCPKLERVARDAFADNLDLTKIIIAKNIKLTYFLPKTFELPKINYLDLHGNNLEEISKDLAFWNDFPSWYIHDNPIVCNCSVTWLWKSLREKNSSTGPDVYCHDPPSLKDRTIVSLQHTDFSCGMAPATQGILIGVFVVIALLIISVVIILFLCRQSCQNGSCINRLLKGHKLGGSNSRDNGTYPRDPYQGYIMAKPVPVTEL